MRRSAPSGAAHEPLSWQRLRAPRALHAHLLAVAVEFGLEFLERVRLQAAPGVGTPPVINALVKIAAFTNRAEAALLLLVNQLHIDRIVPRNNLAQRNLVEIADLQRGIDITARAAVYDPG